MAQIKIFMMMCEERLGHLTILNGGVWLRYLYPVECLDNTLTRRIFIYSIERLAYGPCFLTPAIGRCNGNGKLSKGWHDLRRSSGFCATSDLESCRLQRPLETGLGS